MNYLPLTDDMAQQLKRGDLLVCIKDTDLGTSPIIKNHTYHFKSLGMYWGGKVLVFTEETPGGYFPDRFSLLKKKKVKIG